MSKSMTEGRRFQLWEYRVSHGSLLIRSPADPGYETNVDLVFVGVEYIAAPRNLGEIAIVEATDDEMDGLRTCLQERTRSSRLWVLEGVMGRSLIVAAALHITEHRGDIFSSPFDFS